jgi:DNA-directed RNA polymerase specialized sigma24 family protein
VPTAGPAVTRGDEADLYLRHHRALVRSVGCAVSAPRALIEDACQTAWLILLRRQPARERVFAWLRTVAIHEAYRLSRVERREARLDAPISSDGALLGHERVEDPRACWIRIWRRGWHSRASPSFRRASAGCSRCRAGFTYRETADITGDSVRTVDRQLRRAHACVAR